MAKNSMARDFALGYGYKEAKKNPKSKNITYTKHVSASKNWFKNIKFKGMRIPDELPFKLYRERSKAEVNALIESTKR